MRVELTSWSGALTQAHGPGSCTPSCETSPQFGLWVWGRSGLPLLFEENSKKDGTPCPGVRPKVVVTATASRRPEDPRSPRSDSQGHSGREDVGTEGTSHSAAHLCVDGTPCSCAQKPPALQKPPAAPGSQQVKGRGSTQPRGRLTFLKIQLLGVGWQGWVPSTVWPRGRSPHPGT